MNRKELKPITLRTREQSPLSSGINSSAYVKEKSKIYAGNQMTAFHALAENCGFKTIKEDSENNYDCYSESDYTGATSIQSTTSCPSRCSLESCYSQKTHCIKKAIKDVIPVSKNVDNVLYFRNKEQKTTAPETHLVSRKCGTITPTVDYLDMTDFGNTTDSIILNVASKNGNADGLSSIGPAAVQYTIKSENRRNATSSDKRRARHKIMKLDQCNIKSRNRHDRKKALSVWKLSNKSVKLQSKLPHDVGKSGEYPPQIFKFPARNIKTKMFMGENSPPLRVEDACTGRATEESEHRRQGHKLSENDCTINPHMAENKGYSTYGDCMTTNGRTTEYGAKINQAFSNINSSCLHRCNSQESNIISPKESIDGGMISYLRKLGIKPSSERDLTQKRENLQHFKDKVSKQMQSSNPHSFNKRHEHKSTKLKNREKHCHPFNKDTTSLLSSTNMTPKNERKTRLSLHCLGMQQKASPGKSEVKSRRSRFEIKNCGSDSENSASKFSHLKMTNEVLESTCIQNAVNSTKHRPVENRHQDYNINFNSDDESDDNPSYNSFIGQYLFEMWKHQCLCDVRLKVGNTSFFAHKIVLAAFSDIFTPEDPQQMPTVCFDIPDATEEAISLILHYLYTAEMEITDSVLEEVYTTAFVMEISEITDLVIEILSKPTVDNFEKYIGIRERIGLPANIMEIYIDFVRENLLDIEDSPYILGLQMSDFEQLLLDPNVKVECEEDIMRLVIKWIKYNPCQRSKNASHLLTLINFECIGPQALSVIVEQNRHLFDLASMDIIMGAFKEFALRCKDLPVKEPEMKDGKVRCTCNMAHNWFKDEGNYQSDDPNEGQEDGPSAPLHDENSYTRNKDYKARKMDRVSPQDIRRKAKRDCWGKDVHTSACLKSSTQKEVQYRDCKQTNTNNPDSETLYTIRKKKNFGDASNNFPSAYYNQRSRSASSEFRSGQPCRRPNTSKSDSDTALPMLTNVYCCSHCSVRQTMLHAGTGNASIESHDINEGDTPGCSTNCVVRNRPACDGRRIYRGSDCCQRSRSSSRSSESSQRYNASSSGSSKRVTFG